MEAESPSRIFVAKSSCLMEEDEDRTVHIFELCRLLSGKRWTYSGSDSNRDRIKEINVIRSIGLMAVSMVTCFLPLRLILFLAILNRLDLSFSPFHLVSSSSLLSISSLGLVSRAWITKSVILTEFIPKKEAAFIHSSSPTRIAWRI